MLKNKLNLIIVISLLSIISLSLIVVKSFKDKPIDNNSDNEIQNTVNGKKPLFDNDDPQITSLILKTINQKIYHVMKNLNR